MLRHHSPLARARGPDRRKRSRNRAADAAVENRVGRAFSLIALLPAFPRTSGRSGRVWLQVAQPFDVRRRSDEGRRIVLGATAF